MKSFNSKHSGQTFRLSEKETVSLSLQEIRSSWLPCRFTGWTSRTGSPLTDFPEGFTQLLQLFFGYLRCHLPGERPVPSSLQQCAFFCQERNRERERRSGRIRMLFTSKADWFALLSDLTRFNYQHLGWGAKLIHYQHPHSHTENSSLPLHDMQKIVYANKYHCFCSELGKRASLHAKCFILKFIICRSLSAKSQLWSILLEHQCRICTGQQQKKNSDELRNCLNCELCRATGCRVMFILEQTF